MFYNPSWATTGSSVRRTCFRNRLMRSQAGTLHRTRLFLFPFCRETAIQSVRLKRYRMGWIFEDFWVELDSENSVTQASRFIRCV